MDARDALPRSTDITLALTNVSQQFENTRALDRAFLTVHRGTVHALLGENGAGNTTLMRVAFGLLTPDSGVVQVDGQVVHLKSPADAIAAGIGMVHQHFTLVPAMTVAENIALGGHGRYNAAQTGQRVITAGTKHGLPIDPDAIVGTLPIGAQQRVEILKALVRDAHILILDEPTAVLAPEESRTLLKTMRDFVAQGRSVILITHKLRDALEFADNVTVLRRGKTIYTATVRETDEQQLVTAMLGETKQGQLSKPQFVDTIGLPQSVRDSEYTQSADETQSIGEEPSYAIDALFTLRDVVASNARGVVTLKQATLIVRAGEIVGIAAVEGNGQYELLRVLARRLRADAGTVEIPAAVGFVPEDRHRDALVLDFPLYENIALAGAGMQRGTVNWNDKRAQTTRVISEHDVRTPGPEVQARNLSGGNQQKLVIGRELNASPRALVVENPTRGLDIQATVAVHTRLREARRSGAAIVVYSSDLDEVLALADRVVVLFEGTLREVPTDRDAVGRALLGRTA